MKAIVLEADWAPREGFAITDAERVARKATGSAVWQNPRFAARSLDDPTPGHNEVVVQVRACGVCGSDTHCYETDEQGYIIFSGPVSLPVVPGHEYTGEVVAVGKGVRELAVGDLVAAEGMLNCGVCTVCRTGRPNQCPHLEMVGFSSPGAYAEYITVDERFCWKLDGLATALGSAQAALEIGALVEPISCSYNGIFVAGRGMRPGDHVAVYGAGPIGLGAIALARASGAASITAFDVSAERNALALACGADAAHDPRDVDPAEAVLEATRGLGADLQVEAAGAAVQTMPSIERSFAPGGQMIYLGRTGERAPVMLDVLVTGAASIAGSRGHVGMGCFPRVIRLLEREALPVQPMITSRRPFDDFFAAIEKSCERTDGKILLVY
ncbi:MAG: alcohol dehydrogenase catalytic domain-containing protein [Proteobacteria bacterium]|nr:alcohol dehydrogenase catalytic domain-containing protein [Pseudomonadota bacterium]MCP4917722.1 alcohol dehydrogenase catalytic domain-containing protein [Pseudomonadota bacterium]